MNISKLIFNPAILTGCAFAGFGCASGNVPSIPAPYAVNDDTFIAQTARVKKAVEYIRANDISKMPVGRYEVDGSDIYFMVSENDLRPVEKAPLEAHKKYADLQLVLEGREIFGFKPAADCASVKTPYDAQKDIVFFSDDIPDFVELEAGQFVFISPEWAHAPLIGKGKVKKCVFKIRIDD